MALRYTNSMTKANAKQIAIFCFGKYFRCVDINERERVFEILVYDTLPDDEDENKMITFEEAFDEGFVEHFKNHFGGVPGWRLMKFKKEDYADL